LYKLGGKTDIGKIERLNLKTIQLFEINAKRERFMISNEQGPSEDVTCDSNGWEIIQADNKMGRNATINRCMLFSLDPSGLGYGKFLVLGCHFIRNETPFTFDPDSNKFYQYQDGELSVDLYRSNDFVQFDPESIYIRPFLRIGEPDDHVKVFQFFLKPKYDDEPLVRKK
jgi:hypothetical protein